LAKVLLADHTVATQLEDLEKSWNMILVREKSGEIWKNREIRKSRGNWEKSEEIWKSQGNWEVREIAVCL